MAAGRTAPRTDVRQAVHAQGSGSAGRRTRIICSTPAWSKGFRAAGANPPVPFDPCADDLIALGLPGGAPITYKSDKVTSVRGRRQEQAVRSQQADDWTPRSTRSTGTNIQQIVNLPECAIRFIGNLGKARSRGFDLQATLVPVHGLTFDAADRLQPHPLHAGRGARGGRRGGGEQRRCDRGGAMDGHRRRAI